MLCLSPIALLCIQIVPPTVISTNWFFIIESLAGVINWFSIGFAQLSDLIPPHHRSAAFGLYMGSFFAGIAIGPILNAVVSHYQITLFSMTVRVGALVFAILYLPETLPTPTQVSLEGRRHHHDDADDVVDVVVVPLVQKERVNGIFDNTDTTTKVTIKNSGTNNKFGSGSIMILLRPLHEMSILTRSKTLVLVSVGSVISKMISSANVTLFFFYVESNLNVRDTDVVGLMLTAGMGGMVVQGGLLKYLISALGEHALLVFSFACGTINNLIYGFARNKHVLYVGTCFAQLADINISLLSSLASRNVSMYEQGRIQGALFALSSLAEALGPVLFNSIYNHVHIFGRGTFFVFGSMLYGVGTIIVSLIPPKKSKSELQAYDRESRNEEEQETLL